VLRPDSESPGAPRLVRQTDRRICSWASSSRRPSHW